MLAAHFPNNNDVHIYFENDEINRLEKGKIHGLFFDSTVNFPHSPLEISLQDKPLVDCIDIKIKQEGGVINSVEITFQQSNYSTFKERHFYEFHQGYRHVALLDVNALDFNYRFNYMKLKHLESKMNNLALKCEVSF